MLIFESGGGSNGHLTISRLSKTENLLGLTFASVMHPTPVDCWRALILYGRNASTYKIALGNLLLGYAAKGVDRLDTLDLAGDFIDLYMDRCRSGKPQLGH